MSSTTKEESKSSCCVWCEDIAPITLYSKSNGQILGFCSDDCWSSYSDVLFNDSCPKCKRKANLLQVPASNKDDLFNEEFVNYCDNCFSSCKNKYVNSNQLNNNNHAIQATPKIEKSSSSSSSPDKDKDNNNLNDTTISSNQSSANLSSSKRSRAIKNSHQPYEIWGCFNWESYLCLEGSTPAPAECFKQNDDPPTNEFEINMKLEAPDPRNASSTCIATVVSIMGFRIELRLDGSDNTNDFWLPVDSEDIKPIGYTQEQGGMLQPPLGFRKSPSNWPVFVSTTLNNAVIAPKSCFKTPPQAPKRNLFKVGHKLEAVDRKNPQLICPATISKIRDSMCFISFDGWSGAFDYWTRYDSRDLFPVGWCERSQHPLQMPGNKDLKIDASKLSVNYVANISYHTSKVKNSRISNLNLNNSHSSLNNNNSSNQSNDSQVKTTSTTATTPTKTAINTNNNTNSTISTTLNNEQNNQNLSTANQNQKSSTPIPNKSTQVNSKINLNNGTINNKKITPNLTPITPATSATTTISTNTQQKPLQTNNQNSSSSSTSSLKTLLLEKKNNGLLATTLNPINHQLPTKQQQPSTPTLVVKNSNQSTSKSDNNQNSKHPLVTVHLNLNCNAGEFIDSVEYRKQTTLCDMKIGPSQLNKTMKDILQLIVNCCKREYRAFILGMIRPGNGSFEVETGIIENGIEKKIKLPHFNRASAFWNYLNNFLGGLKCCKNLVSMMTVACDLCSNGKSKKESHSNFNASIKSIINAGKLQPQSVKPQSVKPQSMIKQQQQTPTTNNNTNSNTNNTNNNKVKQQLNHNSTTPINNNTNNKPPITMITKNNINNIAKPSSTPKQQQLHHQTPSTPSTSSKTSSSTHVPSPLTTTSAPLTANSSLSSSSSSVKRKLDDQTLLNNSNNISNKVPKINGQLQVESSSNEPQLSNPNDWSIDDVINFLKMNDKSLDFAELFQAHEIDGKAFLLLDSDMLMKYMKIKLGPALKVTAIIEQLNNYKNLIT